MFGPPGDFPEIPQMIARNKKTPPPLDVTPYAVRV